MNDVKPTTFQEWAETFSNLMVIETMKILKAQATNKAKDVDAAVQFLRLMFIARFIALLVYESLTKRSDPHATKEEVYEDAVGNLSEVKIRVQEAVGLAFGQAMTGFAGKPIDYYCQVKPVPEVTAKHTM